MEPGRQAVAYVRRMSGSWEDQEMGANVRCVGLYRSLCKNLEESVKVDLMRDIMRRNESISCIQMDAPVNTYLKAAVPPCHRPMTV